MVQLSTPKAVEIIISFVEKSPYYWDKVEKLLLKKGIIEDVGPSDIVFNAIKDAKNDLLTELLELI